MLELGGVHGLEVMISCVVGGEAQRIEAPGAITAEKNRPGVKILDEEAKMIKFHGNRVVTG
jgi:hypothetical protein